MRKYITITEFIPLAWDKTQEELTEIKEKNKETKKFKSRKSCENYYTKHGIFYVERKSIFYRP